MYYSVCTVRTVSPSRFPSPLRPSALSDVLTTYRGWHMAFGIWRHRRCGRNLGTSRRRGERASEVRLIAFLFSLSLVARPPPTHPYRHRAGRPELSTTANLDDTDVRAEESEGEGLWPRSVAASDEVIVPFASPSALAPPERPREISIHPATRPRLSV